MKVTLHESQIEEIILEETIAVLEENNIKLDEYLGLARLGGVLGRGALGLGKGALNLLKKPFAAGSAAGRAYRSAKASRAAGLRSAGGKAAGAGAKGAGDAGLRSLGGQTWGQWFLGQLIGWVFVPFAVSVASTGAMAWIVYQVIEEIWRPWSDNEGMLPAAARRFSERAEAKYKELLEVLATSVVAYEGFSLGKGGAAIAGIWDLVLGPFDLVLGAIWEGSADYTELDILGLLSPWLSTVTGRSWSSSINRRRREELTKFHEILEEEGPIVFDEGGWFSEAKGLVPNPNYNTQKLNSSMKQRLSKLLDNEERLAQEAGIQYDKDEFLSKALPLIDEFTAITDAISKGIPDDYAAPGTPGAGEEAAPGTPAPITRPKPKPAEPVTKDDLRDKVVAALKENDVTDSSQIDAWFAWAEATRKRRNSTSERIAGIIHTWFDYTRGAIVQENRQLFNEVKLFTPIKGEFEFRSFKEWVDKNSKTLGQDAKVGLYSISFLENLFRMVKRAASGKKSFGKKVARLTNQSRLLRSKVDSLKADLQSETDPKKKKKIQAKIDRLADKTLKKSVRGSTVRVSKKKLSKTQQEIT